jgi:DNA-binding transcriptional LysR family regulator
MDWRNLQALAILSREGSLAGAARALDVNHATISRRIAALEDDIGEPLVRRLARSTPLTDKGREVAAAALQMAGHARDLDRLIRTNKGMVTGMVRLSAPPALISETLIPSMGNFRQRHPMLRLCLSSESKIASLDRGDADMAVRLVEPSGPQTIARRLGSISYALYATPDYAQRSVEDWEFIGEEPAPSLSPQQLWLETYAAGRPFALFAGDFYSQRAAAEAGIGIALLPERIMAQSQTLIQVTEDRPEPRSAWLVMHSDLRTSRAVRTVADYVTRLFVTEPPSPDQR